MNKIIVQQSLKQKLKKIFFLYYPFYHIRNYFMIKKKNKLLHSIGYEIMGELTNALKRTDFVSFCAFGTLLGLIRDKQFIVHDDDIDMAILNKDDFSWHKFEQQLNKYGFKKVRQFRFDGLITEQTYEKNKLTIDFFLYNTTENSKMKANIYLKEYAKSYSVDNEFSVMFIESPVITGIHEEIIHDIPVLLPNNAEEYLESIYGTDWRFPDPNFQHETNKTIIPDKYAYAENEKYMR